MRDFDTIVIGSGPTAIATLQGMSPQHSIAVVTGATPSLLESKQLHPKMRAVAADAGAVPGVADTFPMNGGQRGSLFATAAVGGLANYWGQQFVRYAEGDFWPRDVFPNYAAYEQECRTIDAGFAIGGGELMRRFGNAKEWEARVPRLLLGTSDEPNSNLAGMAQSFHDLANKIAPTLFHTRAEDFAKTPEGWRVSLQDGKSIFGGRIVLAAGVLGTLKLIVQSWPDLKRARFRDHTPWMSYVVGLRSLMADRPHGASKHFNAVTIERSEDGRSKVFAAVYDLRYASLNLLLASTLGRTSKLLRGWSAPLGSGLVQPTQIWTPLTQRTIEVDPAGWTSIVVGRREDDASIDSDLARLHGEFGRLGAKILKTTSTRPGFGFHYHALEFSSNRTSFAGIAELLRERTGDGVCCVDASAMANIGCRPHTLTAMAAAKYLAKRNFTNTNSK